MTLPTNETPQPPMDKSQPPRMVSIALPTYKPVATMIILAVTVIIYLGQVLTQSSFNGNDLLFILGGKINSLIDQGQVWRLITPVFLHASISHILLNMYALFILGKVLESAYGHSRFLFLYFIAAFAGNVLSFIMTANASLGASTAIFGLIGAEAIFVIRNKRFYGTRYQSTIANIGMIIVLNLVIGFLPGTSIDYWGHLGGLIGGSLFAFLAGPQWDVTGTYPTIEVVDRQKNMNIVLSAFLVVIVFAVAAYFIGGK
jgi:rhomboid protease GluP